MAKADALVAAATTVPPDSCVYFTRRGFGGATWASIEFAPGCGLLRTDPPRRNVGSEITLASNGPAGHAAEHHDLPDMGEGIGDGALQEPLGRSVQGLGGGQVVVEALQPGEEPGSFLFPR